MSTLKRVFPGPRNSCQSFPDGLWASAEGMQIHEYSYGFGFMPELWRCLRHWIHLDVGFGHRFVQMSDALGEVSFV